MFDRPEMNNDYYDDCYFSYDDGLEEALYVFVDGNGFPERMREKKTLTVGETGFGTGLNLLALLKSLKEDKVSSFSIDYYSVEKYLLSPERVEELWHNFRGSIDEEASFFLALWREYYEKMEEGWNQFSFTYAGGEVRLHLFYGDVLDMMQSLPVAIDAWFLDGHSPDKNPDMWNDIIMSEVGRNTKEGGTIATFTAAGVVKRGLRDAGFFIKRRKGFGGKRHMSIGIKGEME